MSLRARGAISADTVADRAAAALFLDLPEKNPKAAEFAANALAHQESDDCTSAASALGQMNVGSPIGTGVYPGS